MSYAYDEDKMMESIRSFKKERKRKGCRRHGTDYLRPTYRGSRVCRKCLAAHVRAYYQRNKEAIKAHKRATYRAKREAA